MSGNKLADARRIYDEWNAGFNTRDLARVMALYADHAVIETPAVLANYPDAADGILRGKDKIHALFEKNLQALASTFEGLYRPVQFLSDGDYLTWEYPRQTPKGVQVDLFESMDIVDGLIVYHRVYWGWSGFQKLLGPKTRMVAVTQMSNVLGTVTPLKEIIRIAHERNIPVLVDGSQGAVHLKVDVQDLGCDFYVCTGHKLYGPTGIGVLYAKKGTLDALPPFLGGGEMIEHVGREQITYGVPPHRFEAGTPPIVEAIGLGAALTYVMGLNRDAIRLHEDRLTEYAHARMAELNFVKIHGRAPGKGSIVSFTMDGLHPHDVSTIIDRSGVAIRAGHHCAQPLMERLGVTATCRASFAMYNTEAEVDALIEALKKAHDFFG